MLNQRKLVTIASAQKTTVQAHRAA